MACRFVLGVGVGGKYPLAATIRAEACTDGEVSRHSATEVAKGFFWQTPGAMLPYVVGLLLVLYLTPGSSVAATALVSLQFRLVLGLGALPALLVMCPCSPSPSPSPSPQPQPQP